ncbi:hypothetical protein CCACVL1_30697 [Corchorus capsularis]|uniref:Uncharacterized protein n=1 Tax=Corchorus capsularis TaxID=210143 RepID=A0A1R3FVY9_COCAP|nr:hypothetical protein CCACVL1_30697 [Corchorus capsularis]
MVPCWTFHDLFHDYFDVFPCPPPRPLLKTSNLSPRKLIIIICNANSNTISPGHMPAMLNNGVITTERCVMSNTIA